MSETKELEGEIQKANDDLKQVGKPGNYKWGVMVNGEWYGFFGTKADLEAIKKKYEAGAHNLKGVYKDAIGKDGKIYHNIEGAQLSQAEEEGETEDERLMREELEKTDPSRGRAHQGLGKPRETLKDEPLNAEEVDALVDKHYIAMAMRALIITNQVSAPKLAPWKSDEQRFEFLLAVFDKLAGPEVYVRADVENYLKAKKGVK